MADGHPAEELVAESGDLDLLVVGSRGFRPLRRIVFGPLRRIVPGSTSAKALRSAECPVIVLPRRASASVAAVVAAVAGERVPIGRC
jgi:nucleotide-binding universal stress UspA family protein